MQGRHEPAVRRAAAKDLPPIERLLADCELPSEGVSEWIDHFWVADASGAIVAVAGLELYDDGALLRSVAVSPGRRGSGIGRVLVERVLAAAAMAGRPDA